MPKFRVNDDFADRAERHRMNPAPEIENLLKQVDVLWINALERVSGLSLGFQSQPIHVTIPA